MRSYRKGYCRNVNHYAQKLATNPYTTFISMQPYSIMRTLLYIHNFLMTKHLVFIFFIYDS